MALLQHNIKTYEECLKYFISGGKDLLLVQDTGTGKSYICMELLQTLFKGKSVLYVVPMWKIAENFKNVGGFDSIKYNVDFVTYNYFLQEENVSGLDKYDVLVFDEAHHIGSEKSGGVIKDIISDNKEKFIIGMTATPQREDKISVEKYFNKTVYGVTVFDCIEEGLMPKFAYILCNDSIIKDINVHRDLYSSNSIVYNGKRYNLNINYKNSKELLKGIVSQHHKDKWICYFGSIAELKQNKDTIKEVFKGYRVVELHSGCEDLDLQKLEMEDNIVILSVDMFLEGIHLKGVKGILISRNVGSVIVFRQILGRVSSIGDMEVPIILDCTNTLNRILLKVGKTERVNTSSDNRDMGFYDPVSVIDVSLVDKEYRDISDLLYELQNIRKAKTIEGYTFNSISDLSRQLNVPRGFIISGFRRGLSYEEIINNAKDYDWSRHEYKDILGCKFKTNKELARQLGCSADSISRLRNEGLSYEEIIQRFKNKEESRQKTILGITFTSDTDLSRQLGFCTSYVGNQRRKGFSYEDIIKKGKRPSETVLGYTFNSKSDLSVQLGFHKNYVSEKMRQGLSYEEIIRECKSKKSKKKEEYKETDNVPKTVLGYTFESDKDLSTQLGKSEYYVYSLRKKGLSYEDIIQKNMAKTISGYTFKSYKDLSLQLGKSAMYVSQCRRRGLSYEEIIQNATQVRKILGYSFSSDVDLSCQLGKQASYVACNRKRGLSYEEIIQKAKSKNTGEVLGYVFSSDADLSRKLGKYVTYVSILRNKGLSYEEIIQKALSTKEKIKEVNGYSFTSDKDLSLQLGKNKCYVCNLKREGLSYEEIIQRALSTKEEIKQVNGYSFKSDNDLSRQLGRSKFYVCNLRRKGKTYEEIIKKAEESKKNILGYTFTSDADLSKQLGKGCSYVSGLKRKGLSYEEIIKRAEEGKSKCTKS